MERFTIGQMAEVNHVTKKTLMLYHKHGLLVPEQVDAQTGYRYYSLAQCSTLDMIQQLKQVGLSLAEIKEIMDKRDVAYMQSLVARQIARLRQTIEETQLSLAVAGELVDTCELYLSNPICEKVTLEYVPARHVLCYRVQPYPVQVCWADDPGLSNWEKSLRSIKAQLLSDGLPLALFHNVGCVVSSASLEDGSFICTGGYLFCPAPIAGHSEELEAGYCLTVTVNRMFDEDGMHMERKYMQLLMEIAHREGMTVRGDYYCEILADTPAFFYRGRDMMIRLRIPVALSHPEASPYLAPEAAHP